MFRWTKILVIMLLATTGFAQETRIVDSLQDVLVTQDGRDKVLTMLELEWEFYDFSFDDCIDWGEMAISEAHKLGYADLEAKANYVLGIQYAHHADLDLAKAYLKESYSIYMALPDTANAFESLWSVASYELTLGSMDSAQVYYDKALQLAELMGDDLSAAYVLGNLAIIHYEKGQMLASLDCNYKVRKIFSDLGDEETLMQIDANIATLYFEMGKPLEAKKIYVRMLPKLEDKEDYYLLQSTCKNLGTIYSNHLVNYDSAMYYFEKSMYYADCQVEKHFDQNRMRLLKSDVLSEMANISYRRGDHAVALKEYAEALALAEKESYLSGQMEACVGLGTVYAQLGQASKSMQYLNQYFALESQTGITKMRSAIRLPLIFNLAHLGKYDDLEAEIRSIDEERAALLRENVDLHDRNFELEETIENLVAQLEQQNIQNDGLIAQMRQYRLAFFGCLALVLALLVGWAAAKLLKHYFGRNAKSPK